MEDAGSTTNSAASAKGYMSEEEQDNRRKKIKDIMKDPSMSQAEKSRAIQSLMDGRRRSISSTATHSIHTTDSSQNYASTMARVAAQAQDHYSSDEEGDAVMGEAPEDIAYGCDYDRNDERSVASSVTHTSYHSNADIPPPLPGTYRQVHGRSYSLQDWNDTDRVAAAANTSILHDPAQISRLMEQSRPNCEHYDRNCTLIAPCCGLAFGCRICHDECPALPKPLALRQGMDDNMLVERLEDMQSKQKMERRRSMPIDLEEDDENHHGIDRFAVREVICRSCYTRQSSKTNNCISCGITFGDYHCSVCNLWMSANEHPYHCEKCGFCRVGGRENFRHCDDCGMCIHALLFDDHNCKAGKYMSNCPVCQEDLFSSRYASHEMPCGHAIHWHCFKELTSYDTRCPVCKKTAETPEHMQSTWSAIAMGIALQPVPPDMARVVNIFCNDCERSDSNRRWHFLGVRCMNCLSFNTNVEQIVMQGRDAADYLDELEASRTNGAGVPQAIAVASSTASQSMDEDPPSALDTSSGSTRT